MTDNTNPILSKASFHRNRPCYAVYKSEADGKKYIVPTGATISVMLPQEEAGNPLGGYSFSNVPSPWMLIPTESKKILYDGRYCAVSGYVYGIKDGHWCVLANKRGEGAPDYKHCWNVVCGFLEADEDAIDGIAREVREETNYFIPRKLWEFANAETNPAECNNGNVTLRHIAVVNIKDLKKVTDNGGEANEVEGVKWIPLDEIDCYEWAFNHLKMIPIMFKRVSWWEKALAWIKYWF